MKYSSAVLFFGGLASLAFAQQSGDGSCDPQNDNNLDATCTGQYAATASATSTNNPRISSITNVDSSIILSTTRNTDILTTSLPHSLDTVTSQYTSQVVVTRGSTYTTNTLDNTAMMTSSMGASQTGNSGSGGAAGAGSGGSSSMSSSSTDSGAMPTAMGNLIPAGAMAAVFGLAAAL